MLNQYYNVVPERTTIVSLAPEAAADTLSKAHRRMLFEESGISPDVAAERGYRTARTRSEVPEAFKDYQRKPGLVVPMYSPDGETVGYQLRPDKPRKGGPKYETPSGISPVVDVHPKMLQEARNGCGPILITEGAKTGDAATSRGICTVVLAGVWMWCVPKVKPYRLKPCFDHIRLTGRDVFVAFDSDCMSKAGVQEALAALVGALEGRGAVVRVIYLPDAADGSKQGLDDYLVSGGTIKEMFMLARDFSPEDIGEIRLSRDQKLRAAVRYLWGQWHDGNWMEFKGTEDKGNWQRGHTARDTEEALIRLAAKSGKPDGRGVVVRVGLRRLSREAAKSAPSVGNAVKHLKVAGRLEILSPESKGKARRYRLIVPSAALYSIERGDAKSARVGESEPKCKGLRYPTAPRLMWASPARLGRLVRRVEGATGRTVTVAVGENVFVPSDYRPYGKRLGPHRGAILDALGDAGGELHIKELCEVLHRKRPWDVRRRIIKPLEKAGIIECEGDVIRLAAEWLGRLEERRDADGEVEQAARRADRHRTDSEKYRVFMEREKYGTPKASRDGVKRSHELRERRMREANAPSGTVAELERVPEPEPALVDALREYLTLNPREARQKPSWLGNTLWAYERVQGKPTPEAVAAALCAIECENKAIEKQAKGA